MTPKMQKAITPFFNDFVSPISIARKQPNDPKLSHGAENRKREFVSNSQIKEQPPLAPARC